MAGDLCDPSWTTAALLGVYDPRQVLVIIHGKCLGDVDQVRWLIFLARTWGVRTQELWHYALRSLHPLQSYKNKHDHYSLAYFYCVKECITSLPKRLVNYKMLISFYYWIFFLPLWIIVTLGLSLWSFTEVQILYLLSRNTEFQWCWTTNVIYVWFFCFSCNKVSSWSLTCAEALLQKTNLLTERVDAV